MHKFNRVIVPALLWAAASVPASAVTYTTSFGAPDTGAPAGQTVLVDFNTDPTGGYALSGDYQYATGTSGAAASPAGDSSRYLYTSSAFGTGSATLSTLDLSNVSFYWGSIDSYNSVDVLGAGGVTLLTVGGSAFSPANGDQSAPVTNQRIDFTAGAGETITGLRFNATGVAFEIDDVTGTLIGDGTGATVPEPATWALMLAGFGFVGFAARRRSATRSVTA